MDDVIQGTWSERQLRYQTWLASPEELRPIEFSTKEDVASALKVSVETLDQWENMPDWWLAVYGIARNVIGEQLGDVLLAMVSKAKKGSVQAAKLCLQTLGVHADKLEIEHGMKDDQLVIVMPQILKEREGGD